VGRRGEPSSRWGRQWQAPDLGIIGASSVRDVWAFSEAGSYLRRSGTRWTFGGLPGYRAGKTVIFTIKVLGPDDTWVFGARTAGYPSKAKFTPYAARFNGRHWTSVRVPGTGIMSTVRVRQEGVAHCLPSHSEALAFST
jgi:hypothetical protein